MNENGERLANFFALNNLVIGGTLFAHKEIHKLFWYSPNRRDKNLIDLPLINGTWRRSLQDMRVRRGADVGIDHPLVVADIKLKLKRAERQQIPRRRFDFDRLRDPKVKSAFTLELRNRFQALQDLEVEEPTQEIIDTAWKEVETVFSESSQTCIGYRRENKRKQ
ncbi:craniofacial development protein 2-like [Diadema antillarum]|uniref:craniofacial development protein 2-like n=1 Tax=Diadema antillarum TaxID=105358 RepID=UPI003A8BA780